MPTHDSSHSLRGCGDQTGCKDDLTRRQFLKTSATASAALPIVPLIRNDAPPITSGRESSDLYRPEEEWRERMIPPEDGKRYGWFIDTRRCFGCHGCEVACKSENDVPLGHYIRQTIYQDVGQYPRVARMFLPMSCQHCEDAPCIKACPSGALRKESGGTVAIDYNVCCGHGNCIEVCPYGAIYLDPVAQQAVKCHNCYHRLEHGLEPACACTCPADAISFGDLNDPQSKVSRALDAARQHGVELVQLRAQKETRPRMWFAGPAPANIEPRVPREGQSYSPDAYNIYNWKETTDEPLE